MRQRQERQRQSFWWAARCGEIQFLRQWTGLAGLAGLAGGAGLTVVLPCVAGGAHARGAVVQVLARWVGDGGPSSLPPCFPSSSSLSSLVPLVPLVPSTPPKKRPERRDWGPGATTLQAGWSMQQSPLLENGLKHGLAGHTGEPFQPSDSSMRPRPYIIAQRNKQAWHARGQGPWFWSCAANFKFGGIGGLRFRALEMTDIPSRPHVCVCVCFCSSPSWLLLLPRQKVHRRLATSASPTSGFHSTPTQPVLPATASTATMNDLVRCRPRSWTLLMANSHLDQRDAG